MLIPYAWRRGTGLPEIQVAPPSPPLHPYIHPPPALPCAIRPALPQADRPALPLAGRRAGAAPFARC